MAVYDAMMIFTLMFIICSLNSNAYSIYGSRRFIRPVRSSWRPASSVAMYYPNNNYYDDETAPVIGVGDDYADTVNYYPPASKYYGRTMDPVDDLQMEMRNEDQRRRDYQQQDIWYDRPVQTEAQLADSERQAINDAFMKNLILAEMYRSNEGNDDEEQEEEELKSLTQVKRSDNKETMSTTTTTPPTIKPFTGQKEVPLLRPPNPAHKMKSASSTGHLPSVYDTIKQLFTLENKQNGIKEKRSIPKQKIEKHFVSSEESLVRQLSGLKNKVRA